MHSPWQNKLQHLVAQQMANQQDGSHDLDHILRVWANCQAISADEPPCDQETLIAAAFLHDIVSLPKNSPERHKASTAAAQKAVQLLPEISFPAGKLNAVFHAIEAHSFSANIKPETAEAKILQDADRLDALGAVGIARTFYVGGKLNSALFHPTDPEAKNRELDDKSFAFDHLAVKLYVIAETMQTPTGTQLAQARVAAMRQFGQQLLSELSL